MARFSFDDAISQKASVDRYQNDRSAGDPIPYDAPRPITAAVERINLDKKGERVDKRPTSAWQTAAWQYFDSIGEIHFAFNLIGQIMSRVKIYPAIITDPDQPPMHVDDYLDNLTEEQLNAPHTKRVLELAEALVEDLLLNTPGGNAGLMRAMGMNTSIPGEFYLVHDRGKWIIASTDELVSSGDRMKLRISRTARTVSTSSGSGAMSGEVELPKDAFVARVWRPHPRWRSEPDSSMLGVLDPCEHLILLQQAMRAMTRSRANAGILFIPEGLTSFTGSTAGATIEDAIAQAMTSSAEIETAIHTVVPLILKGPAELGDKIKWIPMTRQVDEEMIMQVDRALERVMQGLDIPKDVVTGLANVKYSNAIVIDDNLYRAHVEPLVLHAVDALTTVYLRPMLVKALGRLNGNAGEVNKLVNRVVLWADTSGIVTRPDKSAAANEGYDKKVLSAAAWREARGFGDADAPKPEELLLRALLDRGPLSPEIAAALWERLDPKFFQRAREQGQEAAGMPTEISSLLEGEEPAPPPAESPATGQELAAELQGGEVGPAGRATPVPSR